jgi:hypothetical protein
MYWGARMRILQVPPLLGLVFWVTGCSIHPLPEDVARSSTIEIVEKIRCEAQQAIWENAQPPERVKPARPNLRDYHPFDKFKGAAIAYEFQFTITENNKNSASASFLMPLTDGKFSLGISGGKNLQRQSDRNFVIAETFEDVISAECTGNTAEKHWAYPITGNVGLDEVVRTFIKLEQMTKLRGLADKIDANRIATFADKLFFTTSFNGEVDPSVELNPGRLNSLKLAKASASIGADRTDVHKVTIAMAVEIPAGAPPPAARLVPQSAIIESARPAPPTAKNRALLELDRQRLFDRDQSLIDALR